MAITPHSHPEFLKFFGMYSIPVHTKPFNSEKYIRKGPSFIPGLTSPTLVTSVTLLRKDKRESLTYDLLVSISYSSWLLFKLRSIASLG